MPIKEAITIIDELIDSIQNPDLPDRKISSEINDRMNRKLREIMIQRLLNSLLRLWPLLRDHALAGEELSQAVERAMESTQGNCRNDCWAMSQIAAALLVYHQAIED